MPFGWKVVATLLAIPMYLGAANAVLRARESWATSGERVDAVLLVIASVGLVLVIWATS